MTVLHPREDEELSGADRGRRATSLNDERPQLKEASKTTRKMHKHQQKHRQKEWRQEGDRDPQEVFLNALCSFTNSSSRFLTGNRIPDMRMRNVHKLTLNSGTKTSPES